MYSTILYTACHRKMHTDEILPQKSPGQPHFCCQPGNFLYLQSAGAAAPCLLFTSNTSQTTWLRLAVWHSTSLPSLYFKYFSNHSIISVILRILCFGLPLLESSWFSPWKRHMRASTPKYFNAENIWIASPIQQR